MEKFRDIGITIFAVVVFYLILFLLLPFFVDITSSANATLVAEHDMSNYPGALDMVKATPWFLIFIPGAIGIFAIIFILKRER